MRIAVAYENGEVFQHFGRTEQFKLYDVEEGKILQEQIVDTNGVSHGALAGFLKAAEADVEAFCERAKKFELLLVRAPRDLLEISDCIRALQTQKYNCGMITFLSTSHVRITANPELVWTLDGERMQGGEKLEAHNIHHAIRLIQRG